MDVALHPNYAQNHLIYFTYTKEDPNLKDQSTLVLGRAKWDGGQALTEFKELFVADMWYGAQKPLPTRCCGQGPATGSYGSRIQFDKDGKLFMTSGDRNYGEMVHDQTNDFGKLYRFNDDGSIPKDNPFYGMAGHRDEIWTTGHRNGEGLFYDKVTGKLWESEFGPPRRRRGQHHREGQELRLDRGHPGRPLQRRAGQGHQERAGRRRPDPDLARALDQSRQPGHLPRATSSRSGRATC